MRKWNTRCTLQQCLPFTVLKRSVFFAPSLIALCELQQRLPFTVLKLDVERMSLRKYFWLRQHLLFTVCAAECEVAEAQSDDEGRTSQVPERSEGKTKVIK